MSLMRKRVLLKSPVRENRTPGSVRGAARKGSPYRDKHTEEREARRNTKQRAAWPSCFGAFAPLRDFVIQALTAQH